ncbi:hypothetical protein GGI43DRAFT_319019 [Trichoderma evansii]
MVPYQHSTWAWFARTATHSALRVGFWYENTAQQSTAQHSTRHSTRHSTAHSTAHRSNGRSDHGAASHHQRLRGLWLVYVCCCFYPLLLRLLAIVDRIQKHHRTRIYCDDHTIMFVFRCPLTSSRVAQSLDLHYFSRHYDVHQLRICTVQYQRISVLIRYAHHMRDSTITGEGHITISACAIHLPLTKIKIQRPPGRSCEMFTST